MVINDSFIASGEVNDSFMPAANRRLKDCPPPRHEGRRQRREAPENGHRREPRLPRTPIRSHNTAGNAGSRHLSRLDAVLPAVVTMTASGCRKALWQDSCSRPRPRNARPKRRFSRMPSFDGHQRLVHRIRRDERLVARASKATFSSRAAPSAAQPPIQQQATPSTAEPPLPRPKEKPTLPGGCPRYQRIERVRQTSPNKPPSAQPIPITATLWTNRPTLTGTPGRTPNPRAAPTAPPTPPPPGPRTPTPPSSAHTPRASPNPATRSPTPPRG